MVAMGIDRMKHRWIGPMLLAASLSLAACAPTQSGGERTASPAAAPAEADPSTDADEPSSAPAENPGSDDYDY
jgi:hypothetical protein